MREKRSMRLASLMKREISNILLEEVSDPRIGFVSLTEVTLSPDFHQATVHVSILGTPKVQEKAMQGLLSATPYVRTMLARRIKLRTTPELHFEQDRSLERGSRILKKLNELKEQGEG